MFGDEPDLKLVGANDVTYEEVIRAIVACFRSLFGHSARLFEENFVSFEKARNLNGHFFASTGRTGNDSCFGNVRRHGETNAAQKLDTLGNGVNEFVLFFVMLVEEKMELVKSVACDLPVMLFVEVAKR